MIEQIRLPAPYDFDGMLAWWGARAIDGVEEVTDREYRRLLVVGDQPVWVRLEFDGDQAYVRTDALDPDTHDEAVSVVRRMLDLDTDPSAVDADLAQAPGLAQSVSSAPGMRVPGFANAAEALTRAIVGQQITVELARTMLGRSMRPTAPGFPAPDALVRTVDDWYRGPRARRDTLVRVMQAVQSGELVVTPDLPGDEIRERLLPLRGIGPWTASYVALRVSTDRDVAVPGDVALFRGARTLGVAHDQSSLARWMEHCRPWRSYACLHLWRAASS